MENYIINLDCGSIRRMTREKLSGNWLKVYAGVALAYILSVGMVIFLSNCVPLGKINANINTYNTATLFRMAGYGTKGNSLSLIAYFYQIFISEVFLVGLASFLLRFVRKNEINPGHIFDSFEYYFKCLGLIIIKSIFILGWALLFIIPGIIKIYSYSQSYYILAEDPTKGILQCITESRRMMDGNKAKLFLLQLSFIGWAILSGIPYGIIYYMVKPAPGSVSEFVIFFLGMLPVYVIYEYINTSMTVFYNLITGFTQIPHLNSRNGFNEAEYHFTSEVRTQDDEKTVKSNEEAEFMENKVYDNVNKENSQDETTAVNNAVTSENKFTDESQSESSIPPKED